MMSMLLQKQKKTLLSSQWFVVAKSTHVHNESFLKLDKTNDSLY